MRLSIILTPAAVLILARAAAADTTWVPAGNVSGAWNAAGSPYMIQGDITVAGNTALSVGPGVVVFFTGSYSLKVDTSGLISALGEEGDSIYFTSDTVTGVWWDGIKITSAADTCRFDYCVFAFAGGAHSNPLSVSESAVEVSHCWFRCNGSRLTGGDGAGLALTSNAWAYVRECDFFGGRASNGAATFVHESTAMFEYCRFEFNQAWMFGGAADVWTDPSEHTVIFRECLFFRNQSGMMGGAVTAEFAGPRFENCAFIENSSPLGGAYAGFASIGSEFVDCKLLENSADSLGGAIYDRASSSTPTIIQGCSFVDNQAPEGGGIYVEDGVVRIERCTIVRNVVEHHGAGIYALQNEATVDLNTSIVAFNHGGAGVAFPYVSQTRYNDFFGNDSGAFYGPASGLGTLSRLNLNGDSCDYLSNVYLDPLFADIFAGDCPLSEYSPCIDAGDTALDLDPDSTIADIGAFYYPQSQSIHPEPATVPARTALLLAYPNPFNAWTVFRYESAQAGRVRLTVFDLLGREVAVLKEGFVAAGSHSAVWDAARLPSGLYFAVLEAGSARSVQKVALLR